MSRFMVEVPEDLEEALKQQAEAWGCKVAEAIDRLLRIALAAESSEHPEMVELCIRFLYGPFDKKIGRLALPRCLFAEGKTFRFEVAGAADYRLEPGPIFDSVCKMVQAGQESIPDVLCLTATHVE